MGVWKQFAEYLYIKKRDPNDQRTQWMKYMHGMNRISLLMFLVALVVMIFKLFIIPYFKRWYWEKKRLVLLHVCLFKFALHK